MRILLDQNIPRDVKTWLKTLKPEWKIEHTSDIGYSIKTDYEIFSWAQENCAVVISFDEDFADRRGFAFEEHCGIIRLKVYPTTIEEIQEALTRLFSEFSENEIFKSLIIIDNNKIRIRHQ